MKHKGTKEIETERLVLRQFTKDDAEVMYSLLKSEWKE